jgi:hypothetical protein
MRGAGSGLGLGNRWDNYWGLQKWNGPWGVVRALGWWKSELDRGIHNIDQTTKKDMLSHLAKLPNQPKTVCLAK